MLDRQDRIEKTLHAASAGAEVAPARLHYAMRYAVLGGGKRVRPLLAYGAGELAPLAGDGSTYAAAAVELIHAYSLVHDDMPAWMTTCCAGAGRPACRIRRGHRASGRATACRAWLSRCCQNAACRRCAPPGGNGRMLARRRLARHGRRTGDRSGSDRQNSAVPELEFMHIHKTGALIRASVALGARCGERAEASRAGSSGPIRASSSGSRSRWWTIVLDAQSSTATLGKTAGKDARRTNRLTSACLGVVARARACRELRDRPCVRWNRFGNEARRLRR